MPGPALAAQASIKACVASTNPVKVGAARLALEQCFPQSKIEVIEKSVPSGVSDQPMTDEETKKGAVNRAKGAREAEPDCDLYFGIEGGLYEDADKVMICFAWVVVEEGKGTKEGSAKTSTFALPQKLAELIRQGVELGEADDRVFGRSNSKQGTGTVGKLTNGLVDRTQYYVQAAIMALIPFIHPDLY
mmetsp:Transcript_46258/g.112631  ORF Transcript_46258/g.112631 Transcript_46258/m.112631 type:complete len:189 (-) Transcript_46258:283-849(-)